MHYTINNLLSLKNEIEKNNNNKSNIIAVSKTFSAERIIPLIEYGHKHFGENKVQEAVEKWSDLKEKFGDIKLHLVGKLQTNKVKFVLKLFDYIHSVDSEKLAKKISDEQTKIKKKVKIFLQVNVGNEDQKSGINKNDLNKLVTYSKKLNLDLIGLMCIPPANIEPEDYFNEMNQLNKNLGLIELSMGMSYDYFEK